MKIKYFFLLFLALLSLESLAQGLEVKQIVVRNGIGLGSAIAVVISWERNRSVLFAVIHGILSWVYVIYFVILRAVRK